MSNIKYLILKIKAKKCHDVNDTKINKWPLNKTFQFIIVLVIKCSQTGLLTQPFAKSSVAVIICLLSLSRKKVTQASSVSGYHSCLYICSILKKEKFKKNFWIRDNTNIHDSVTTNKYCSMSCSPFIQYDCTKEKKLQNLEKLMSRNMYDLKE